MSLELLTLNPRVQILGGGRLHPSSISNQSQMEASGGGGGGGGDGGLKLVEIETSAEGLSRSDVFHVVKEIIGFVLYMHQQIPAILQNLEHEFDTLKEEYKQMEETVVTPSEGKASSQRKHNLRKREAILEVPNIQEVTLVLGASPARPQHVYEIIISHGRIDSGATNYFAKSKAVEALSRKAIRGLISSGAGSCSYTGPSKLFLLIKISGTSNLLRDFLPKRDFRYSKKIMPFKLHIKCKVPDQADDANQIDMIWFQCRHAVKGLASSNVTAEC